MTRRDAELQSDTQRPRQRHPPSASLSGRGESGRGGRGRLAQETIKSGSGHRRLEACGPSNGRHKLV